MMAEKTKLQQLFVESKPVKLLNNNLQARLKRCNLEANEEVRETINN